MATKTDVLEIMREWAPEDTAEPWDNVGLQLDMNREINHVGIALELNIDTWNKMSDKVIDFVVVHHPLIFKPLSNIGLNTWSDNVLRALIKNDTGLYVSHTNLDKAEDGVSDALFEQYDLKVEYTTDIHNGYGKIKYLNKPVYIENLLGDVSVKHKVEPRNMKINSIAFCGGSGKSLVPQLIEKKVDVFITGELGYHDIQALRQEGIGVLLLGHYESEVFILEKIEQRLSTLDVEAYIFN